MPRIPPPGRYTAFLLCCLMLAASVLAGLAGEREGWGLAIAFAALVLLGVVDMRQPRHSIRRNYPVIGHVRWWVEAIRPEIRQYLIEADEEAAPFSRDQRALVYARAKGKAGEHPFGT